MVRHPECVNALRGFQNLRATCKLPSANAASMSALMTETTSCSRSGSKGVRSTNISAENST